MVTILCTTYRSYERAKLEFKVELKFAFLLRIAIVHRLFSFGIREHFVGCHLQACLKVIALTILHECFSGFLGLAVITFWSSECHIANRALKYSYFGTSAAHLLRTIRLRVYRSFVTTNVTTVFISFITLVNCYLWICLWKPKNTYAASDAQNIINMRRY